MEHLNVRVLSVRILTTCWISCLVFNLHAQSKAHLRSKIFIIDPAYKSTLPSPEVQTFSSIPWLYGYSELQCWRLQVLRNEGLEAKLNVGYPGEYHQVYHEAKFIFSPLKMVKLKELRFYSNGDAKILVNDQEVQVANSGMGEKIIKLKEEILIYKLEFRLLTDVEPPCLLIKDGTANTGLPGWQWEAGDEPLQAPERFPQLKNGDFPHRNKTVETIVRPIAVSNDVYDFGRELLGYLYLSAAGKPEICTGESIAEARQIITGKSLEQTMEFIPLSPGIWRSKVPLAFRYVRTSADLVGKIYCGALLYPAQYQGAFACSDTLLNKIWMNSAYTLRLCRNDFLCDGIKRDRLPWAGDLAMSMMVNAYVFGDGTPVKNSLVALNRAGIKNQDINGIIDYDLWWLIAENQYQIYYDDPDHLKQQWKRIKETAELLNGKCDSLGLLKVKNAKWLFIDWVKTNKNSALQILWWWAQQSVAEMAIKLGDPVTTDIWRKKAGTLKRCLYERLWDQERGAWMDDPYQPKNISRHANILAVISGLSGADQYKRIAKTIGDRQLPAVGTPYMAGFEGLALSKLGEQASAINNILNIWGGMLKQPGTTTFWEAYKPSETDPKQYSFYSRPYGKSLCHAWSSGPAALLQEILIGIHPLEDGWKTFQIDPKPGSLAWISIAVPTPRGIITVDIEKNNMILFVPGGSVAKWRNEIFKGPLTVARNL